VLEAAVWLLYVVPTMALFLHRIHARTHGNTPPEKPVAAVAGQAR